MSQFNLKEISKSTFVLIAIVSTIHSVSAQAQVAGGNYNNPEVLEELDEQLLENPPPTPTPTPVNCLEVFARCLKSVRVRFTNCVQDGPWNFELCQRQYNYGVGVCSQRYSACIDAHPEQE